MALSLRGRSRPLAGIAPELVSTALLKAATGTTPLLPFALEYDCPDTVLSLEAPFEHIPDEGAGEEFESNCRAKHTLVGQGATDVLRPTWEPDLANPDRVTHGDRDGDRPTSAGRSGRRTIPLAVKRIRTGVARQ